MTKTDETIQGRGDDSRRRKKIYVVVTISQKDPEGLMEGYGFEIVDGDY